MINLLPFFSHDFLSVICYRYSLGWLGFLFLLEQLTIYLWKFYEIELSFCIDVSFEICQCVNIDVYRYFCEIVLICLFNFQPGWKIMRKRDGLRFDSPFFHWGIKYHMVDRYHEGGWNIMRKRNSSHVHLRRGITYNGDEISRENIMVSASICYFFKKGKISYGGWNMIRPMGMEDHEKKRQVYVQFRRGIKYHKRV